MKLLKTLLVWMLLLALPLQALAAVSVPAGGTGHAPAAAMHASEPGMADSTQLEAADHCAQPADEGSCSKCASCCVGAPLAPRFGALDELRPVGAQRIPYRTVHVTAHIPGGLERPPHSLVA